MNEEATIMIQVVITKTVCSI